MKGRREEAVHIASFTSADCGRVVLPDGGHVGELLPLRAAPQRLQGGVQGEPARQAATPLRASLGILNAPTPFPRTPTPSPGTPIHTYPFPRDPHLLPRGPHMHVPHTQEPHNHP